MGRPAIKFCIKHQCPRKYYPKQKEYACLVCKLETVRRYQLKHPVKVKASQKRYRVNNLEKCKAAQKRWRANNAKKCREYNRRWFAEHRDKNREYSRRWRTNNPEKNKEVQRRGNEKYRAKPGIKEHYHWCRVGRIRRQKLMEMGDPCAILRGA